MMMTRLFKHRAFIDAVKLLSVALAYFVCGRLGLALPSVDSHITLIWLPTGIAVAALLRWGYICWPGIFLGALATNYSIDSSPLLDSCIALGNTAGPLLAAWVLQRLKFQGALDRARDISFLVAAAVLGMLASASAGVISLRLFGVLPAQNSGLAWLSWWAGDVVGVLMAVPLLLNISFPQFKYAWAHRVEFLAWTSLTLVLGWGVFFLNNDSHALPLVFTLLPLVVWAAMRFGVTGSSLAVLLPAGMATVATSLGSGPFRTVATEHGLFVLWLYLATLVLVNLMVAALQAGRKRAEVTARQVELQFRQIFEQHNSIMLLIDPASGMIVDANMAASRFYGYSPEHLRNMNIGQINTLSPEQVEGFLERMLKEKDSSFIVTHCLSGGEIRTVEVQCSLLEVAGRTLFLPIIHDVTERRAVEQSIQEAKERVEITFNGSPNAEIISRLYDGHITDINNAFTQLSGYTKQELMGNIILDFNFWIDLEVRRKYVDELESKGLCVNFEAQFKRKDGSIFTGSLSAGLTTIQGVRHIVATILDITERKIIERKNDVLVRRHQALMKSALEGIHIMDMRGNIVEFNDTFCQMLGYTREEAAKLSVADWDAQWSPAELMERFKQLITVDGALFETRHRRKDGTVIDVEVSITGADIDGEHYLYAASRDIIARKKAEIELRNSEQKSRMLMDNAADAVFVADPATENLLYINERFEFALGYSRAELVGNNMFELVTPAFRDVYRERFRGIVQSGGVTTREIRLNRKDGTHVSFEMNAATLPDGTLYGACRNITERKLADEALRIAAVTFNTQEAIMITAPDGRILRVNQSFHDITGYGSDEVVGQSPRILQSGRHNEAFFQAMWSTLLDTGKWAGEVWDKRKDGSVYPKSMTITAVYNGQKQVSHYVAVFRDISNLKQSEQEIHQLAFYDALTKLPNRRLLLDRLQQAMATGSRSGRYGALLFLDLDHFKTINDTRGHAAGDELLVAVASRLHACVREGDSVARMGGDEFVVVLENLSSIENEAAALTESVAEKILGELDKPYVLSGFECLSTVSIGVSLFRGHLESAADLLQHTDVAMYQAKAQGRNAIRFFDPHMQTALQARATLEADLRQALEKQQFRLQYQIQVDRLRRPLGAEVLLRWEHPQRGLIPPDEFIPLAEETGLIVPIGLWVLQTACAQLGKWQNDALTRDLTLAVNVSAKQFRQVDFVAYVQRALQESGAKPTHLKL
ncbi:MAG: Diguanylate cyclase/phosphodiesterase with PAS/PAC sensor(S) [Candidatus Gallionella acididurans]|uniref:Diguanylate cyclase/phosphodiesterase with PAS/PAC sensor(S) n=1 Tax=Candidatus Gallionella acididurans TaxID=1796491 RepID=A0A139BVR8_9PROT|nr:MAG: Diguanylate cyclase/phosphodiesterase with PAS/PAC sensor(S) [Candidatus Gallionella acididurans]